MTQASASFDTRSIFEAEQETDLLEQQLETLFSDSLLSRASSVAPPRKPVAAATAFGRRPPSPARPPQPLPRPRIPELIFAPRLLWIVGAAATLFILVALAYTWFGPGQPLQRTDGKVANSGQIAAPPFRAQRGAPSEPSDLAAAHPTTASEILITPEPTVTEPTTSPVIVFSRAGQTPSAETASTPAPQVALARVTPTIEANPTLPPTSTLEPSATNTPAPSSTTPVLPSFTETPPPTAARVTPPPTAPPPTVPPPTAEPVPPPTRILIPAINLDAPIIEVGLETLWINGQQASTWKVPAYFAAGWHHSTAAPGRVGNTVLNGHQSGYGEVFRDLEALQVNDEVFIYTENGEHRYRVTQRHLLLEEGQPLEVRVRNAQWILPTNDERLTLVTCAPYSANSHRLILVALPVASQSPDAIQ